MLWRKYKLKSPRHRSKVLPCFFGCVNFQIIEHYTNLVTLWILAVEYFQKFDIVLAVVGLANQWDGLSGL